MSKQWDGNWDKPDWMPQYSASSYPEGTIKSGSTGQRWQVRGGQWVRLTKLEAAPDKAD
jgi:hypothetical protein